MNIIEENSVFSIHKDFAYSSVDEEVMSLLYLPLIKMDGFGIYNAFYSLCEYLSDKGYTHHEDFLKTVSMSAEEFLKARSKLEAIGLLETYRKSKEDGVLYVYKLIPPASPKKFFNDPILKAFLLSAVGEKKASSLKAHFKASSATKDESFENVSAAFPDIYSFELSDDEISSLETEDIYQAKEYKKLSEFTLKNLDSMLEDCGFRVELKDEDKDEIVTLVSLYGAESEKVLELIRENTDSSGNFYLPQFRKSIRTLTRFEHHATKEKKTSLGSGSISKTLTALSTITPQYYLASIFNANPAKFMLDEIEKLKEELGFSNALINVVLDYSLRQTKKEFNTSFIEKVAYSISANEITDPYEAMTFLSTRDYSARKARSKKASAPVQKKEDSKNEDSDAQLKNLLGDLSL